RVNISILTDFLIKLMKLPISFFATKTTGDIMQRMSDQQRIEGFLTGTSLNTLFSLINLVIFTFVLIHFNTTIFLISFGATLLYLFWILAFLSKRRELNHKQFLNSSTNQTTVVELVQGMTDIKLNNCEQQKRWEWELVQATMFKFKVSSLSLTQYQQAGSMFINQAKNILITFLSVKAVIDGDMTLGGMMAIQYVVGQVSNPVDRIVGFIQSYQDAKISLERLNEIHDLQDEEPVEKHLIGKLPEKKDLLIKNLSFKYPGAGNDPVLKNLNMSIPQGKITAIVGESGSGKTTILKVLMRSFEPQSGGIRIGDKKLDQIALKTWRNSFGAVTQEGYIFADTVVGNI
ncbi:MAG: ATP-binding cassette domain-containing protein, partial [Flavobacterium sp.]